MVVRIDAISEWQCIQPGKVLNFEAREPRRIRVEVNCPEPTRFDVVGEDGKPIFLAVVQGHETLIFSAGGEIALTPSTEGEVWYYTMDGFNPSGESLEQSFASVMIRRERNPQLEWMEFKMRQNEMRRDAQLEEERAAMRAFMAEMAAKEGADEETGELPNDPAAAADATQRDGDGAVGAAAAEGAGSEPAKPAAKKAGAANGKA